MARIVIVGGGISGLSAAFALQRRLPGAEITVLESESRPGGTIWTERAEGFQFEVGPNGFLDVKPSTLGLCERLGLAPLLVPASKAARARYLLSNDRLQVLPDSLWSFVRTPLLSVRAKLAILTERFRHRRAIDRDESVREFAARRTNTEVADVLADALVTGIFAGDAALLSMSAAFPRIAELERKHGSISRGLKLAARERRARAVERGESYQAGSRLWSLQDGLRTLIEALAAVLHRPPILGVRVRRLLLSRTGPSPWLVRGEGNDAWPADVVLLACPAPRQATLLADLDPVLSQCIAEIPYAGVVVVGFGFRKADVPTPLEGFGYIAPQRLRRDALGVQWCSSIFPDRVPEGMVLVRVLAGGWHRRDILGWDDDRLLAALRDELRLTMGITAPPVFCRVVRWPEAIPQYTLGHQERVASISRLCSRHAGLFLGGNAYRGVAMNDCTEQGEVLAEAIARFVTAAAPPS